MMVANSLAAEDSQALKRKDWKIVSLIGSAHASSHFFQLVFPTLYLSLAHEYGYDFARLGLLATVFFLVSCFGQASSGFVVDRIRSEEHTSELQSLMRISYSVFCLKKKHT